MALAIAVLVRLVQPVLAADPDPSCLGSALTGLRNVTKYYVDIDSGDLASVVELFSDGATYQRGSTSLVGKDAIRNFYTKVRALKGRHEVTAIRREGETIVVDGVFRGTHQGKLIELKFEDHWTFGPDGKVIQRESVLEIDGV